MANTLYADDGSIRVTVVSGYSITGLYAPDGSMNVIVSPGSGVLASCYHPCGAMYVTLVPSAPSTPISYYAPDGSVNVTVMPLRIPGIPSVTLVSGTWGMTSPSLVNAPADFNFTKNTATINNTVSTAASAITFSRSTTGYAQKRSGEWVLFGSNVPRITDRGLLVEPQRTNYIRNNSMQGAVVGGSLPTNWGLNTANPFNGITISVADKGVDKGIDYIDVNFSGTSIVGGQTGALYSETYSIIAAQYGQTWTSSCFYKLIQGNINLGLTLNTPTINAGLSQVTSNIVDIVPSLVPNDWARVSSTFHISNNTVVWLRQQSLRFVSPAAGTNVNFTIRVGWPQLELSSSTSSMSTATVVSGGTGYTNGDVLTVSGGTFSTACTLTVTGSTAGVIDTVSITNAGSYTVAPAAPTSVTGGTGTGATFSLTTTTDANTVFAGTSPIRTTSAAVTRNDDSAKIDGTNFTSWFVDNTQASALIQWNADHGGNNVASIVGGFNNDATPATTDNIYLYVGPTDQTALGVVSGGVTQFVGTTFPTVYTPGNNRAVFALQQDNGILKLDSNTAVTDTAMLMPLNTITMFKLGSNPGVAGVANGLYGYLERIVLWNTRLPDSDVQTLAPLRN